jgi:catalase
MKGFISFPEPMNGDKLRGKPEKFADHYTQATLFWHSQTAVEQAHIVGGFRFELSKVTVPVIRERMLASLVNVAPQLAAAVADGLGMAVPKALPRAIEAPHDAQVQRSPSLSLAAHPGDGTVRTRQVAILVAPGVTGAGIAALQCALREAGAAPKLIGSKLGAIETAGGIEFQIDATFETSPSVLFDAVVVPDGVTGVAALSALDHALGFLAEQYRHGKTLLALGAAAALLTKAGVASTLPDGAPDPGVLTDITDAGQATTRFIEALARHRHPVREQRRAQT